MVSRKISLKEIINKKIEFRHSEIVSLNSKKKKNMDEGDRLRIYGLPNKKPIDTSVLSRDEIKYGIGVIPAKPTMKKLTLDYNRYINNMLGIIIVNLNQITLTRNCIETLKNQINQNFKIYLFDQNSNEVGTENYLLECENNGIQVYKNKENIPLNHLWSNFKYICDFEYLCFLNNDVELSNTFVDDTIKILDNESTVGAVIHITNNKYHLKSKDIIEYKIFNELPLYQGWDFSIRKKIMPDIPEVLKIFGGDDYIFAKLNASEYKIAIAYSSPIIHYKEKTRITVKNISQIQQNDALALFNIMRAEKLKQVDSTLNHGISGKYPEVNMKLNQNENCIFTAIIGDYDNLTTTTYSKLSNWDYICFTDNENIKSDFWRVIYMSNISENMLQNVKLARYFKTNFYKYLSSYKNLMWIDARITLINDINEYLKNLKNNDIVFLKHPDASSIAEEFVRVLKGNIEKEEIIELLKTRYAEFDYKYDNGLISSGVMLFNNNERVVKFFNEWWNEIDNYSHRDQLSANFVLWRNPNIKYIMIGGMINKYFKQLPRNTHPFRYE
jgi:hypothetical protein